jgi:tetraacyldisaccharide 4'-kinase
MDEAALHELLSGRRSDVVAKLLRCGLQVASWGYTSVMSLRNLAYTRRWLKVHQVSVPVISFGNITTGGTGKTPLAAWLANWLVSHGRKPGLLSRGYRTLNQGSHADPVGKVNQSTLLDKPVPDDMSQRENDSPNLNPSRDAHGPAVPGGNDEKLVLDRLCPGVPHLQQRDRVNSARREIAEFGCDVLLLDDGFQHRRLHRDLDLVLVDALKPWGYGHVLPRGLLRESMNGLRRADLVVITRADQCPVDQLQSLRDEICQIRGSDEVVEVAFKPNQLVDVNGQPHALSTVVGMKAFAFCGIGNPDGFRKTVTSLGVNCKLIQGFPDHHHYQTEDLSKLAKTAREHSVEIVLTTQKDIVKISADAWHGPPLFAIEIGVEFIRSRELLETHLRKTCGF